MRILNSIRRLGQIATASVIAFPALQPIAGCSSKGPSEPGTKGNGGSQSSNEGGLGGTTGAGGTSVAMGAGGTATNAGGMAPEAGAQGGDSASVALCATPDPASTASFYDLKIVGVDFARDEGRSVYLVTRSANGGVLGSASAVASGGGFSLTFPRGYQRTSGGQVLWFVDVNADGFCDTANGDHFGLIQLDPSDAGDEAVEITISDDPSNPTIPGDPSACTGQKPLGELSDLDISATGFEAHAGARVYLITRTALNGAVFAHGSAVVVDGGFRFHFPRGLEQFTYQEVFWFVDTDGDGRCTHSSDHTGFLSTNALRPAGRDPAEVSIKDNHTEVSERGTDVCVVLNACPF